MFFNLFLTMKEISISDLSPKLRRQLNKADYALNQGNRRYAIDIYLTVVEHAPCCLEVRQQLRKIQNSKHCLHKNCYAILDSFRTRLLWPKWRRSKTKAESLILCMEKALSRSPSNIIAHKIIADAAESLELKKTAIFAYETLCQLTPDNLTHHLRLADIYMKNECFSSAITVAEKISRRHPHSSDAIEILQRASLAEAANKH